MPSICCSGSKFRKAFVRPLVQNPISSANMSGINKPAGMLVEDKLKNCFNSDWV